METAFSGRLSGVLAALPQLSGPHLTDLKHMVCSPWRQITVVMETFKMTEKKPFPSLAIRASVCNKQSVRRF